MPRSVPDSLEDVGTMAVARLSMSSMAFLANGNSKDTDLHGY